MASQDFDASALGDNLEEKVGDARAKYLRDLEQAVAKLKATLGGSDNAGEVAVAVENIAASLADWENRANLYRNAYNELDASRVKFSQSDIDELEKFIQKQQRELQRIGMHLLYSHLRSSHGRWLSDTRGLALASSGIARDL